MDKLLLEIMWNDLVENLEYPNKHYPSDKELATINWGNSCWTFDENGFSKIDGAPTETVDYASVSSSKDLYLVPVNQRNSVEPKKLRQSLFRDAYHRQIIETYRNNDSIREERIAILTHGPIASGKTSAIDTVLHEIGKGFDPARIDYDRVKRVLPEYDLLKGNTATEKLASQFVQSESSVIAQKIRKQLQRDKNRDIIFEGSQSDWENLIETLLKLRDSGFFVYIVSTIAPLKTCLRRAQERFERNKRYVPKAKVEESYEGIARSWFVAFSLAHYFKVFDQSQDGKVAKILFSKNSATEKEYSSYFNILTESGLKLDEILSDVEIIDAKLKTVIKRKYGVSSDD